MSDYNRTVLVTGVSGRLGERVLLQLSEFDVVGADSEAPTAGSLSRFERVELEREESCMRLVRLLRETRASAVVHLACVEDIAPANAIQAARMWQVNVAGTARVMEAITEVHRSGGAVRQFIIPTSAAAYGPYQGRPATEESRLLAESLPCAVQKREADEVARYRAESLGDCSTCIMRPSIYAGPSAENYFLNALRGIPSGHNRGAERRRRKGQRMPFLIPRGDQYLERRAQFVHTDDLARLIAWTLRNPDQPGHLTVLNVSGRGEPLELGRCLEIAQQKVRRLPGMWLCRRALRKSWEAGKSSIPPEALPYVLAPAVLDTSRLQRLLGPDYASVIRYTAEEALKDSFNIGPELPAEKEAG